MGLRRVHCSSSQVGPKPLTTTRVWGALLGFRCRAFRGYDLVFNIFYPNVCFLENTTNTRSQV